MVYIHSIIVSLFIFITLFFSFGIAPVYADSTITQIGPESQSINIKKLQTVFSELDLYTGTIDGNYSSIKDELIEFQVQNNIVSSADHPHAGYYGKKTRAALKAEFGKTFEELVNKHLVYDKPVQGKLVTFNASAYYSPVRGQKKYLRGSYEREIQMQGSGNTANGTTPHPGTIAMPRAYSFGTKVYLEGIGVGTVEDRGGAIQGNKIDIWMGVGDEGRERAVKFGRRNITGYIVDSSYEDNIEFGDNQLFIEKNLTDKAITKNTVVTVEVADSKDRVIGNHTSNSNITYVIDNEKKQLVKYIAKEMKKLLKKQTSTDKEYNEALSGLKTRIRTKLIPAIREEETKNVMNYLIQIL